MGKSHRVERHMFLSEYRRYIEKKYGKRGVIEWLFHLALDSIESANKLASYVYRNPYAKISVEFHRGSVKDCTFEKK